MGIALRDAHMRHHFHNENYNWGITNALGDMILGTWKHLDEIPKSTTARHLDNFNPQKPQFGYVTHMSEISIGLIGAGMMGQEHIQNFNLLDGVFALAQLPTPMPACATKPLPCAHTKWRL